MFLTSIMSIGGVKRHPRLVRNGEVEFKLRMLLLALLLPKAQSVLSSRSRSCRLEAARI